MTRIKRREFFMAAAATTGGVVLATIPARTWAADQSYKLFVAKPLPPARPAEHVEIMFKAPGPRANGLQATDEGLWIIDPSESASHAYLVSYEGTLLREFATEGDTPSGITFDGETLWIASTYSREIIRCDAQTGRTIQKYFTPGAGVIFSTPDEQPGRRSPLTPNPPQAQPPSQPGRAGPRRGGARGPAGAFREGTGGHGLEWKAGKLWLATPPSRTIYRIDPETWTVEHMFPAVDRRPHGIGFEGDALWESDTNHGAFYKRDPESGEVMDAIRLSDADPLPHGMTVRDGYIWWCDDVTNNAQVCRLKISAAGATL